MSQWIEHLSEPKRLMLSWEPPLTVPERTRWIVGEVRHTAQGVEFRYLTGDEFSAENNGRSERELRAAGYLGYPAFDSRGSDKTTFDDHVLEAFLRRLPPSTRSDFTAYLEHHRIQATGTVSAMALLGATEARLPGDGFSLIDPFDPQQVFCDAVIEVAGHRHYPDSRAALTVGKVLELEREPDHPYDPNAVRISVDGVTAGYVNRVQAPSVSAWLATRQVEASVLRLNGSVAKPRAFLFIKVRPSPELKAA
ncbi:HIRAN domain-containing protein [Brevundimonas sp.]|uniref:HIRAN domain-containing protein n=1 Tax=Brevundimonas sp. TaxID=1871086 RepID=UPI0035144E25